jgi:hypothetical protein
MGEVPAASPLPAWLMRLAAVRHKPWFAPAGRMAARLFTVAVTALLLWQLTQLGWERLWRERPTGAGFYLVLVLLYFVQPLGEWVVFRRLWQTHLPFGVCLQKRILNNTVFSYSGEAYLYLWARKNLSLPHAHLIHTVKDSSLLSGAANTLVLLSLLGGLTLSGAWRMPALNTDFNPVYWLVGAVPVISAAAFLFARRKITTLSASQVWFVFTVHLARNLVNQATQVALWTLALPTVPLAAWLNFLAARLLLMQLSFLPSGNLFHLAAGIGLAGALGLPQAEVAVVLLVVAAGFQGMHFATMALNGLRPGRGAR